MLDTYTIRCLSSLTLNSVTFPLNFCGLLIALWLSCFHCKNRSSFTGWQIMGAPEEAQLILLGSGNDPRQLLGRSSGVSFEGSTCPHVSIDLRLDSPGVILWDGVLGKENFEGVPLGSIPVREERKQAGQREKLGFNASTNPMGSYGAIMALQRCAKLRDNLCMSPRLRPPPPSPPPRSHPQVLGCRLPLDRGCDCGWGCRGQFPGRGSVQSHQPPAPPKTGARVLQTGSHLLGFGILGIGFNYLLDVRTWENSFIYSFIHSINIFEMPTTCFKSWEYRGEVVKFKHISSPMEFTVLLKETDKNK